MSKAITVTRIEPITCRYRLEITEDAFNGLPKILGLSSTRIWKRDHGLTDAECGAVSEIYSAIFPLLEGA